MNGWIRPTNASLPCDFSEHAAYGHEPTKDTTPFNNIEFHNLNPACDTCNSGYNTGKKHNSRKL
jgi:hypothetical protein